ncbi:MAG TPA: hypothetical protein VFS48_08100 [Solirubrobacterales bacterium]|nr:hypothetical protein [Solirubrobacterales bacterium]
MSPLALDVLGTSPSDEIERHGAGRFTAFVDLGELGLQGWVVGRSDRPSGITVRGGEGELIARAPLGARRPDIAEAFPGVAGAEASGFRVQLAPHGRGTCSLYVFAILGEDDSEYLLGSIETRVDTEGADGQAVGWTITALDRENAKVLAGRDGWLFLREDTNDVLGQHMGQVAFGKEDRDAWQRLLENRMATVERVGAVWECLVAPDKEAVYPEHLPGEIVPAERRPIHDFLKVAETVGAPVTYLLDDLVAAKSEAELYFKNDTHWNQRGAFVAYRVLAHKLAERGVEVDLLDEAEISWVELIKSGDLGEKCYPQPIRSRSIRALLADQRAVLRFDNEVRNHGRVIVFERPGDDDRPSCVVFGESFVDNLMLFLRETFGRLVFVHTSMLVEEIVRHEQPDVVLTVPVERFLMKVPDDRDGLARLAQTAEQKGGRLPWASAA